MTSSLVESILFIALLVTSVSVLQMYRELRKLRSDQAMFQASMAEASRMFDALEGTLQDVRRDGLQIVEKLEERIDEGRALINQLETRRRDVLGSAGGGPAA